MKGYRRYKRRRRARQNTFIYIGLLILLLIVLIFVIGSIFKLINSRNKKKTPEEKTTKAIEIQTKAQEEITTKKEEETTTKVLEPLPWYLILVNASNPIAADPNIELETLKNGYQIDKRIVDDLQAMFDDARAQGLSPVICSSYRTMSYQTSLFDKAINSFKAKGYSDEEARSLAATDTAIPGTSEHQLGLALDIVDINNQILDKDQENTPVQQWLMANCYKYGFILRYPEGKEDITGIMYEPWHYRYVGKEAAEIITKKNITLEEYLKELGY